MHRNYCDTTKTQTTSTQFSPNAVPRTAQDHKLTLTTLQSSQYKKHLKTFLFSLTYPHPTPSPNPHSNSY